jgi:altronate dehydratase
MLAALTGCPVYYVMVKSSDNWTHGETHEDLLNSRGINRLNNKDQQRERKKEEAAKKEKNKEQAEKAKKAKEKACKVEKGFLGFQKKNPKENYFTRNPTTGAANPTKTASQENAVTRTPNSRQAKMIV